MCFTLLEPPPFFKKQIKLEAIMMWASNVWHCISSTDAVATSRRREPWHRAGTGQRAQIQLFPAHENSTWAMNVLQQRVNYVND